MNEESLSAYIGETTAYDKKLMLERNDPISWLKSVSAFANTAGGKLLYGVRDNGELVGLANAAKDAEDISEIIKMKMDPVPQFTLTIHEEDGKQFVVVDVSAGDETPYYAIHKGAHIAYVRIGNESVKASAIELKRLVLKGTHRTWDSLISGYLRRNYSFDILFASYHESTKLSFEETDFLSFGLVADDGKLTNAGALFADHSPIRHSRVFCTRWNGLTKSNGIMDALDDDEFSGGLISLLEKSLDFVSTNTKKQWRKTMNGRVEYPEYPMLAVRECIVNGLIHRDYLELGSEVHVDLFDDRMEIYSPGGLMGGIPVQSITDIRKFGSRRRNPVIADLFQRLDLMERRGSGFGKILDAYKDASERVGVVLTPSFLSNSSDFVVTLPNLHYALSRQLRSESPKAGKSSAKSSAKVAQRSSAKSTSVNRARNANIIVQAIKANPCVSIVELRRKTHLSDSGVRKVISRLKLDGILKRVGGTHGGHWEVIG